MNNQQKFFATIAVMVVALFAISSADSTGKAIDTGSTSCNEEYVCSQWDTYETTELLCGEYEIKNYDVCISYKYENGMECATWDVITEENCLALEPVETINRVCEKWEKKITC